MKLTPVWIYSGGTPVYSHINCGARSVGSFVEDKGKCAC